MAYVDFTLDEEKYNRFYEKPSELDIVLSKKFIPVLRCVRCKQDNYAPLYACENGHITCLRCGIEGICSVSDCGCIIEKSYLPTRLLRCLFYPCPDCGVWTKALNLERIHYIFCPKYVPKECNEVSTNEDKQ